MKQFSLNKAAIIIASLTLASRLVGLLRDRLFASRFGAGDTLDVYYAAFRIPDFIFNLLILGTLSVAFIPVFTEWLVKDKSRAYKIANTILNTSFLLMFAVCLMLMLLAGPLTKILVPGFSEWKFQETLLLTKIFLWSPVIFTVSNVFGSILNSQKKFFIANLAPLLYNFGIIFGLLFLYPRFGLKGLGSGVILGAMLHLLIQAIEAMRFGFVWKPAFNLNDEAVKKIGRLFLPRIFGLDTSQISLLIGSVIGSLLTSGTIAVLNLANNLQAVPVGIFAISLAVASFPVLSEQYALGKNDEFSQTLADSIIKILFFLIPISVLTLIYRAFIVRLVYGAGNFNWNNTIATFNVLGVFAISMFAQGLIPLFSRAFYARHNTATPVVIGLLSMGVNIGLAYFLAIRIYNLQLNLGPLSYQIETGGASGIALGFSLASILNCLLLFVALRSSLFKKSENPGLKLAEFDGKIASAIWKIIFASACMGILSYSMLQILAPFLPTRTVLGILLQAGISCLIGAICYIYFCNKFGLGTAKSFVIAIKNRF